MKAFSEFHRAEGTVEGHRGECKECSRKLSANRYRELPGYRERAIERVRRWQEENPERHAENQRRWRDSGRKAVAMRRSHLKRKYGLTLEQYDAMLLAQGGGCAICGAPEPEGTSLHVDHHHDSGDVRGLLCFACNAGIGQFREDPALLRSAAEYLRSPRR